MKWDQIPTDKIINKTAKALEVNGIKTIVVASGEKAKEEVLKLIAKDSQVMTATSTTAQQIGLDTAIDESTKFESLIKLNPYLTLENCPRDCSGGD